MFTGKKGQDVILWLRTVDDYFVLVNCIKSQKVVCLILLLVGNVRCWWDAEYMAKGSQRPENAEEFKMLLQAQFESPVRETRA